MGSYFFEFRLIVFICFICASYNLLNLCLSVHLTFFFYINLVQSIILIVGNIFPIDPSFLQGKLAS